MATAVAVPQMLHWSMHGVIHELESEMIQESGEIQPWAYTQWNYITNSGNGDSGGRATTVASVDARCKIGRAHV